MNGAAHSPPPTRMAREAKAAAPVRVPALRHAGYTPGHKFWPLAVQWLLLSAWPVALLWWLKPWLMRFWQAVFHFWSQPLALSLHARLSPDGQSILWSAEDDAAFAPSSQQLMLQVFGVAAIWLTSGLFSDRWTPLRTTLRALCLIHLSSCLFFLWAPASFPYSISKHLQALMEMGLGFMLAIPPMLTLGWGLLKVPLSQKLLVPCLVLAYFAVMLPHQWLLHAWLLEHLSILFMPVLFLCMGTLLDLWIFVAIYAWLASTVPVPASSMRRA